MAAGTRPQGKLLDYEQFIDHQLGLTRAKIKMTDVVTAGAMLVAVTVGVLFLEVLLDHYFGLPLWLRQIVLVLGMGSGVAYIATRIIAPMLRNVNGLYAAKTIELADPAFKNSLMNYLELRRNRESLPRTFLAAVEAKAVEDLTRVEVDNVVNQKRLIQTFYVLAGIVVAFCLYSLITPKPIFDSVKRALLADLARPTNTRLTNIRPGDDSKLAQVVASSKVTFSTEVQGARPDKVTLHYSTDGGQSFLVKELARGRNEYDPWKYDWVDIQQSMDYYVTAADGVSRTYHVKVLPEPMVTSASHDLDFPSYARLPRKVDVAGGNIEALEGTIVTIHARVNEPAEKGWLRISGLRADGKSDWTKTEEPSMEVSSDRMEMVTKFKLKTSGQYMIKFTTTGGQTNNPTLFDIKVLKDKPPTAQFLRPDRPELKVPANAKVSLRMTAADDLGLKDVALHVKRDNQYLQVARNYLEKQPPSREFTQDESLDLAKWNLKPGTRIEYFLTVSDTREPLANRLETSHQTIEVTEPVAKEELQKLEQEQKKLDEPPPADSQKPSDADQNKDEPEKPSAEKPEEKTGQDANESKPQDPGNKANDKQNQDERDPNNAQNPANNNKPTAEDNKKLDALEKALGKKN